MDRSESRKVDKLVEDLKIKKKKAKAAKRKKREKKKSDSNSVPNVKRAISSANSSRAPTPTRDNFQSGGYHEESDLVLVEGVSVHLDLSEKLKPHQVTGVKFMWKRMFPADPLENGDGTGCLLAHHMGLGKSLQVVTLIHTALTNPTFVDSEKALKRILIVAPKNVIINWANEFRKWITGNMPAVRVLKFDDDARSTKGRSKEQDRLDLLRRWKKEGGVFLVNDSILGRLSKEGKEGQEEKSADTKAIREILIEAADMVICDEAHTYIKNDTGQTQKALRNLRTKRRIALSGTPIQNNLDEYFHMIDWLIPGFLGIKPR